ncbi:fasciclin domain-containing protein [Roseibium sp. MMSF_3544]|uniref:fasciclin domain-containing protein n=1 Tax=unclassified Roseibium TaxID=2629323 RepID=UPI00273FD7FF|nr:fasciclin domain-containing protein [Roseibium sp. MMSF_3544]
MSTEHETNTILDIATTNDNFNILAAALSEFPDLVKAAGDKTKELTVFAPTDEAFTNLAKALGFTVNNEEEVVKALIDASTLLSPSDDPTAFLGSVLPYHIAPEELDGVAVAGASSIKTLSGETIHPDSSKGLSLGDKDRDFADPNVTNPSGSANGIEADNGIIHVIDNVLLPFDLTFAKGGFLFTGRGPDAVIGSDHFDFISLGSGNDIANGLGGHDVIFGGRGHDLIKGGDGDDNLFGGRGKDTLEGGGGNDKLIGGRGMDMLEGGADDDYLNGGRGKDTLEGEEGNDFLVGGRSADSFVFNPFRAGEGHDVVADFNAKRDKLVLDLSDGLEAAPDLLAEIAAFGDPGLQFTDLLEFDLDAETDGLQAAVSLGASEDGDLLITHLNGTIELNGISPDVELDALLPAIQFVPEGLIA